MEGKTCRMNTTNEDECIPGRENKDRARSHDAHCSNESCVGLCHNNINAGDDIRNSFNADHLKGSFLEARQVLINSNKESSLIVDKAAKTLNETRGKEISLEEAENQKMLEESYQYEIDREFEMFKDYPAASSVNNQCKQVIDTFPEEENQYHEQEYGKLIRQDMIQNTCKCDSNSIKKDQDVINSLRRDLINYEQLLAIVQNDLQSAFQNIETLKMEKLNLAAQLAYERQTKALCLQSVTDQLTRIGTTLDSGSKSPSGILTLTPVQQTAFKTEISRLIRVLESEEQRLMDPLASRIIAESSDKHLTATLKDHRCIKPTDLSLDSKYQSTGVHLQKQAKPLSNGMVRCFSAPVKSTTKRNTCSWNQTDLGRGKDYTDTLFSNDKCIKQEDAFETSKNLSGNNFTLLRSPSSFSSLHDMKIVEIQAEGNFIRILNSSNSVDHEIGNYILQQNTVGHPISVFRFPPRVHCSALATVTVWSEGSEYAHHQPPSNFIFQGKPRWSTGANVSTILCRPNGKAIAWNNLLPNQHLQRSRVRSEPTNEAEVSSETSVAHKNLLDDNTACSDNSWNYSLNPLCTNQTMKQAVIPGLPFAGASGQRLGSASLRRYRMRPISAKLL